MAEGLLSLLREATSRRELERFMTAHGVDPATAREAARRCEAAALEDGAVGAAVGGLLSLFATSPVGGIGAPAGAMIGLTVGAGNALLFSQQCREVQDAAFGIVNNRG